LHSMVNTPVSGFIALKLHYIIRNMQIIIKCSFKDLVQRMRR